MIINPGRRSKRAHGSARGSVRCAAAQVREESQSLLAATDHRGMGAHRSAPGWAAHRSRAAWATETCGPAGAAPAQGREALSGVAAFIDIAARAAATPDGPRCCCCCCWCGAVATAGTKGSFTGPRGRLGRSGASITDGCGLGAALAAGSALACCSGSGWLARADAAVTAGWGAGCLVVMGAEAPVRTGLGAGLLWARDGGLCC